MALLDGALVLIVGLALGKIMNKFKVPLVAGYVLAGLLLGKSFLGIINGNVIHETAPIADMALGFIAFNIGEQLRFKTIRSMGKSILLIAFFEAFAAFFLVTLGLYIMGQPMSTALLLGAVSSATAPAATVMVINEYRAKGPLTNTLLAVVAIDDAICLMIYSIASSIAKVLINSGSTGSNLGTMLGIPILEIIGSFVLGGVLGFILNVIIKRLSSNDELLILEIGFIALTNAAANFMHLSPLLACMTLGIVIANISIQQKRAFKVMGNFVPPVYTCFFVLAGARLDIHLLMKIGTIGIAYEVLRITGKVLGASFGARLGKAEPVVRKYIGWGLLSQIGVAIGLAISVSKEFPGTPLGDMVITILLATTIFTEIIGPISTRLVLLRSKEATVEQ